MIVRGGFAFQLIEDGTDRGGVAAVGRELKILFVCGHGFFRFLEFFVRGAEHLINDRFAVGKLIDRGANSTTASANCPLSSKTRASPTRASG